MAKLISVRKSQCFACRNCGTLVTWWQNRNGKPILVEVHEHSSVGLHYRTGMGNHGNFTPWHNCRERTEQLAKWEADRKEAELQAIRDNVAKEYLPRLMAMAQGYTPEKFAEAEALGLEYKAALEKAEAEWRAKD